MNASCMCLIIPSQERVRSLRMLLAVHKVGRYTTVNAVEATQHLNFETRTPALANKPSVTHTYRQQSDREGATS